MFQALFGKLFTLISSDNLWQRCCITQCFQESNLFSLFMSYDDCIQGDNCFCSYLHNWDSHWICSLGVALVLHIMKQSTGVRGLQNALQNYQLYNKISKMHEVIVTPRHTYAPTTGGQSSFPRQHGQSGPRRCRYGGKGGSWQNRWDSWRPTQPDHRTIKRALKLF